jgi:hypothetical protein
VTVSLVACRANAENDGAEDSASDPSAPSSPELTIAYDDWASTLERFVDESGLVDYAGLRQDRDALDRFLDQVGRVSPRNNPDLFSSEDEALAYFINVYNALTFQGVLGLDPDTDTVWGATGTGLKFFGLNKYKIGGETLSLKQLEDDWIRADFGDPRIHAALNCASLGCPRLPQEPFLPATLDQQLDAAMTEFVNQSRVVKVSTDGKSVSMSKIFDWFRDDFLAYERAAGNPGATVIDYINRYRAESDQIPVDAEASFPGYDKRLNRQE